MTVMERLAASIVVPVVVLDKVEDAIPTAKAMAAGGVDTMEITFRTACAPDAIRAVADNCPDVLVGAGTIVNVEQAKLAVEMGAKFIVSPGFSDEVVGWCVENNIPVAPGCVTPTEIMAAMKQGLTMVKFFPANVYGGLNAMKNLSAPFVGMKFLPTGGVNTGNIISASAQITLERDGKTLQGVCIGDGPVDAAFMAIDQIVGHHYELDDFQIQAVTEGKEAVGQALVKLRDRGRLYSGTGISTDILGASLRAYLNAVNKIIYEEA